MSEKKDKKGVLATVADGADKVVGDIILGGIGQGAYHLARVPGVGAAMRYVGENVGDGWNKAADAHQKRVAVRLVQKIAAAKERPSAEKIREMCVEAGISAENLSKVEKACEMALTAKDAAVALVKGTDVPLPGKSDEFGDIDGTLVPAPAVG